MFKKKCLFITQEAKKGCSNFIGKKNTTVPCFVSDARDK